MAGYEHYDEIAKQIEHEIVVKGIVLGIDWTNEAQVGALAHEALDHLADDVKRAASAHVDHKLRAKVDLYGLAAMMLRTMEESADTGFESHGGVAWKAFSRALWKEAELRKSR